MKAQSKQLKKETPPGNKTKAKGEAPGKIQLEPIKTVAGLDKKPQEPSVGEALIEHPHNLEIDPELSSAKAGVFGKKTPVPMGRRQLMLSSGSKRRLFPGEGHMAALPQNSFDNLKQKVKVNARRIESLGNRLLKIDSPENISFNPLKSSLITPIWTKARVSINQPKGIDNKLPQVTERMREVDDPQQIKAITTELSELAREFSSWGSNSGNKLSKLRPDLKELTESDSMGRRSDVPLAQGGPDKADRQAAIIRGKREQASKGSDTLERIRVEESPRHLPTHDISANVSAELNQVAEKLENVDVASIKANMSGMNIRDFIVEKQRTLEILNEQLPKAKDFQSVNQITHSIAEVSAQLGKLTLDSVATAESLANQQYVSEKRKFSRDNADRKLRKKIKQDGRELLKLSRQIKQDGDDSSRADTSSRILGLARGLGKVDFDQVVLNDPNRRQLSDQLRKIGRQLQKTSRQTTDAAGLKNNYYAVAALSDRLDKLGVGDIGFTASIESRDKSELVDLQQLVKQLSDLSPHMQTAAQSSADYQTDALGPEMNKKLMEELSTGSQRLEQIKQRLELAGDQQEMREELGTELLKLSNMLKNTVTENTENIKNPLKDVSTKAITSIGSQIKEVGQQLSSDPAKYDQISKRLHQMAGKLQERDQELDVAQLGSDQDITKLSSDLLQLAAQLDKIGPDAITEQRKLLEEARGEQKLKKHQRLIDKSSQDLFTMSRELAELSANYTDMSVKTGNNEQQIAKDTAKYTERLGRMVNELKTGKSPKQLDRRAFESLGRELADLSQGLRATGLARGDGSENTGELSKIAAELAELSQGLLGAKANLGDGGEFGDKLNQNNSELELSQEIRVAELGRGEGSAALDNTNMNALLTINDVDRNDLFERLGEIRKLNEKIGREQDPMQSRDMVLEMAKRVKELADYPPIAKDLAAGSDTRTQEFEQKLEQINDLDSKLGRKLDPKMAELMGENLLKLADGLSMLDLGEEKAAVSYNYPDIEELALKLGRIQHKMKNLGLSQLSSGASAGEESGMNQELGLKLKQISSSIDKLPYKELEGIGSTLNRMERELSSADMPDKGAASRRLAAGQKASSDEAIAGDSHGKKRLALKNIDQALKRVRRLYKKAGDRYNPDLSQRKLKLAVKGKARANKGIIGKLEDSPKTKGNFSAAKASKDIKQTPKTENIKNVYAMERDLSRQDVFERIIKRLEHKKERIQRFETAALKPVKSSVSARTGDIKQPDKLDNESRMLAMAENKFNPAAREGEKQTPFTEKPSSYKKASDSNPFTYELSTPAKDIDQEELLKLPLEQSKLKYKRQKNLTLHNKQARDEALADQLIPLAYRQIIKKLYLDRN